MNMAKDRLHGRKTLKVENFLDEFEKDEIKKYVNIVDLLHYLGITLTKKGKSYMGRCPWHNDTHPSLSVDPVKDDGVYHCFGCGESGDIFTLTEKMKGIEYKEALKYLKPFKSSPLPKASVGSSTDQGNGTDKESNESKKRSFSLSTASRAAHEREEEPNASTPLGNRDAARDVVPEPGRRAELISSPTENISLTTIADYY